MKILLINACIRDVQMSRTYRLYDAFVKTYQQQHPEDVLEEIVLRNKALYPLLAENIEKRNQLLAQKNLQDPIFHYAHTFAQADKIIISAPYWDLSFPALLKIYFEHICVTGITFKYTEKGVQGLCKASKLLYISTLGGFIETLDLGKEYIKSLGQMFGIPQFDSIQAEGLDIEGAPIETIMAQGIEKAKTLAIAW